ncbi:MAG: ABC transporter substrate-binding protein [Acetobacteraceae bacterium]|nr:ABC transporter substrate-binding protein [Acetobacteraceae bacterium]
MCLNCFSRRDVFKLAGLLSAGVMVAPRRLHAQASNAPVRIGYLPITDAAPLLLAHANGYFEAEGIAVEKPVLLRSWAQVIEAFLSGQVNVIHLLSPMAVWARFASKAPVKMVAWNHVGGSGLTVAPEINSLGDLGGKTVAIPFWYSIHNVVLQAMLRAQSLNPVAQQGGTIGARDVNLIVMAPSDMPPALAAKQIAGFIVADPFNAAAELLGIGKILRFTGDVWRNHACCVMLMNEADLQQRPDWSQKVVNAVVKAQLWARANRADSVLLLSKDGANRYTPHAPATLGKVLSPAETDRASYITSGAIQNGGWNDRRIDFQPFPYPSYTEELIRRLKTTVLQGSRDFLTDLDPVSAARDLTDDRFVRHAIAANGGFSAFGAPESFTRRETIQP